MSHPAAPPPGPPAAVPPGPPHPVADRPGASPVDAVIADITAGAEGLGGIHELELVDAAARFDALHAQLQDALSDLDRN